MRLTILVSVFLMLMGMSCKTKTVYVPVETIEREKEYIDRWSRDSIYLHDSIYVEKKGDTLWFEKYKTIYKEKLVRDSIFITDSVRVEVPYAVIETKEVNRLKTWQTVLMCLGAALIGYLGFRVIHFMK